MDNFTSRGYEIIKELGANRSAGRVAYLAKQLDNNRLVVIKQFQFARSNSSWDGYKEIEREVAILKQLQHPNIPRYLTAFETEQGSCIVQEYINGRPLSEIISSQQLFTPEQVKDIILQLLEILVYLQESFTHTITHRDVKPANILIDADFQPFLLDFGGAKVSEGLGGSTVAVGTLGFMPPEQRFGQFNKTTDIYSLGLTTLSECITQTCSVKNNVPDTLLEGWWEVAPHPSDPPHTPNSHAWISFGSRKFAGNDLSCDISIDTSKLKADKTYLRTILLHTNSHPETREIALQVRTAAIPQSQQIPYRQLILNLSVAPALAIELSTLMYLRSMVYADFSLLQVYHPVAIIGAIIAVISLLITVFIDNQEEDNDLIPYVAQLSIILPLLLFLIRVTMPMLEVEISPQAIVSIIADVTTFLTFGLANIYLWKKLHINLHLKEQSDNISAFVTGVIFGISALLSMPAATLIPVLLLESVPLVGILFYNSIKLRKKIAQYRSLEQSAIDS